MYLPALAGHPQAELRAICGRRREPCEQLAQTWDIAQVYTGVEEMLSSAELDALIITSPNDTHYEYTLQALERGVHVLCEKPLALSYAQAREMADTAEAKGLITMTPFTYSYMPTARYLKQLLSEDYIGQPYHLNMRYYAGFGRDSAYSWRFDAERAGSGALGDIASHFLYLAYDYFGEVAGLFANLGTLVERPTVRPNGEAYEVADDNAILTLTFNSGAQGVIQASPLAYEDTPFGQIHALELHGSAGTLHSYCDWDTRQEVHGARVGEGAVKPLIIPDTAWQGARRDTVHHTYKDVFRQQDTMSRAFVSAVAQGQPVSPSFREGAYVQRLLDAALESHRTRAWVDLA